jgi:predicted lipoprotein
MRALAVRAACRALLIAGAGWTLSAAAAAAAPREALPFYRPVDAVQGLYGHWLPARANAFAEAAAKLEPALQAWCEADAATAAGRRDAARTRWKETVLQWDRLSALPVGPLLERRTARQIDFTPTRPELIARAIERAPQGAAAMERIGSPAKGLPALEWLLWTRPAAARSPACAYAREVAADVAREAAALSAATAEAARKEWDEASADAAFSEFVNQWFGALERLRWQEIERPTREAATKGRKATPFPRQASGATAATWAAHWQGLRELAVQGTAAAPVPGQAIVPLETYLRGRGLIALADRWAQQIAKADAALDGLAPGKPARLTAAARTLDATKRLADAQLAPALKVNIGFSDADGD